MQPRSRRRKKDDEPRLKTGGRFYDRPVVPVFADEDVGGNLSPERRDASDAEEDGFPLFAEEPIASDGVPRRTLAPEEPELFADEDAILQSSGTGPPLWFARGALALGAVMLVIGLIALSRSSPPALAPPTPVTIPSDDSARPAQREATLPTPMASPSVAANQVALVTDQPDAPDSLAPSTAEPTAASAEVPAASQPPAYLPGLPAPEPITELGGTTIGLAAPPRPMPAPPAAASALPVEPSVSSDPVDETAGVREVLARYVEAYASLDVRAVAAVWPTVNQAALGRAFGALEAQNISFSRCSVTVSGATARAMCAGTAAWTPKIGGRRPREDERTWTFALTHRDDSWAIVSAQMR